MKFQMVFDGSGAHVLEVKAENEGEKQMLTGMVGSERMRGEVPLRAEIVPVWSGDRNPAFKRCEAIKVVINGD